MEAWEAMRAVVKDRVDSQGVKQKFLASKCGYDERAFSSLISGRKTITAIDIKRFCDGIGICPNDLFLSEHSGTKSPTA